MSGAFDWLRNAPWVEVLKMVEGMDQRISALKAELAKSRIEWEEASRRASEMTSARDGLRAEVSRLEERIETQARQMVNVPKGAPDMGKLCELAEKIRERASRQFRSTADAVPYRKVPSALIDELDELMGGPSHG